MKNIFDEFNAVDIDLDEYKEFTIDDKEVNEIKNRVSKKLNTSRRKHIYKPVAAIIAGVLITTMIINYDSVSASIEGLTTNLKSFFTEKINKDFSDYTFNVGERVEDKNIGVTLNEFIIDNNLVIINYNIDYSKAEKNIDDRIDIQVNNKQIKGGYGSGPVEIEKGITNYKWIFMLEDFEATDPLNVNIIYKFYNEESVKGESQYVLKHINGKWNYNFNISDKKINKGSKSVTLNENNVVERNGEKIKITDIVKTDISLRIKYEYLDESHIGSMAGGSETNVVTRVDDPTKFSFGVYDGDGDSFKMSVFKEDNNKGELYYFINDKDINKYIIKSKEQEIIVDFTK